MPDRQAAPTLERTARREARTVLIVWALALVWSVGYCYLRGYQHAPDAWVVQIGLAAPRTVADFEHIAGFPDWVFVGILIPWVLCTLFTFGFALYGMTDDDLGAEAEEQRGH